MVTQVEHAVGSCCLGLQSITHDKEWNSIMGLTRVRFSPSLMYIASTSTVSFVPSRLNVVTSDTFDLTLARQRSPYILDHIGETNATHTPSSSYHRHELEAFASVQQVRVLIPIVVWHALRHPSETT